MRRHQLKPGTRIKLTSKFLRSTGQQTGPEGLSRWTVQPCDCSLCRRGGHVATDEAGLYGGPRHLAISNIQKVK
jgi:hypothetical protein